ncbi:MAG: tetratricopeptide repeat protein [Planctomycetaceae bacterium]|nr:tetratricopeptide repeat protein [Planctomycetaceae bacterium]
MRTFQDAQSAFEAGDFQKSASLYEQLLDQGVRSGTIYYNLGNAWTKADEPVRAVAAYYLAKRYIPNDPHLNANLHAVLTSNGGSMPPPESSLFTILFFWQNGMGYSTKIWGSLVLAALTFGGGTLYLFRQTKRLKRSLVCLAILTAIAFVSVGYDWYRFEGVRQVVIATDALPRKGNSEQYEPAFVSPMPFGTLAAILDERNDWYCLRFSDGQEGWLPKSQTVPLR